VNGEIRMRRWRGIYLGLCRAIGGSATGRLTFVMLTTSPAAFAAALEAMVAAVPGSGRALVEMLNRLAMRALVDLAG
jgi:hypothetical protein